MKTFGDRLQYLLNKKKLKQNELQILLNKTGRNTINQWVKNRAKPQADDLIKLSKILEVSTDWLLGTESYPPLEENSHITIAMEDYVEYLTLKNDKLKRENESLKQNDQAVPDASELTK